MKSFRQIRERKVIQGTPVSSKRINKHNVSIVKHNNKFVVYIDKEKLDAYRSQKEAEKMGAAFAKEM